MYIKLSLESRSLDEDSATYIAEVFNAKITWIPFMKKLPVPNDTKPMESRAFNYSKMTVSFGSLTNIFGYTKQIKYAFSDSSLQTLAIYMQKQKAFKGEMADDFVLRENLIAPK